MIIILTKFTGASKSFVELEEEANHPQERRLKYSDPEVRYCIYMMEKYGEDYKVNIDNNLLGFKWK